MRLVYLACGDASPDPSQSRLTQLAGPDARIEIHRLSEIPTRPELKVLDQAAAEVLPHDPTPSLDEISRQPDVAHLGEPARPPQQPDEELRVVVEGSDAALGAVLTRMMRGDYLWASVGFLPAVADSPAATNWALPADREEQLKIAVSGDVRPAPVIRNDTGSVVAGSASVTAFDGGPFEGEVVVDNDLLLQQQIRPDNVRFFSQFGARLVPATTAPGIVAVRLMTPAAEQFDEEPPRGFRAWLGNRVVSSIGPQQAQSWYETPALKWMVAKAPVSTGGVDPRTLLTGRALQCGGNKMLVTVDGVAGKRPVDRVTFYRHLRDLQIARP